MHTRPPAPEPVPAPAALPPDPAPEPPPVPPVPPEPATGTVCLVSSLDEQANAQKLSERASGAKRSQRKSVFIGLDLGISWDGRQPRNRSRQTPSRGRRYQSSSARP